MVIAHSRSNGSGEAAEEKAGSPRYRGPPAWTHKLESLGIRNCLWEEDPLDY